MFDLEEPKRQKNCLPWSARLALSQMKIRTLVLLLTTSMTSILVSEFSILSALVDPGAMVLSRLDATFVRSGEHVKLASSPSSTLSSSGVRVTSILFPEQVKCGRAHRH